MKTKYLESNPSSTAATSNQNKDAVLTSGILVVPKGYYRLNLLPKNKYFSVYDLFTEASFTTCTSNSLCYDNTKKYACKAGRYAKSDGTCSTSCGVAINPHRLPNLSSTYSGYCTSKCGTAITCLATGNLSDQSTFQCMLQNNLSRASFFCYNLDNKNTGGLHYGSMFSPPEITIPVSPTLNNYHIEIWYLPDPRYRADNNNPHYFFRTNSFHCKKKDYQFATMNDYGCYHSTNSQIGSDVTMTYVNWQRLAFSVTGSGSSYTFSFHFNKYNNANQNQSVTSDLSLSEIKFCSSVTCGSSYWASGFYKWLRVYDATFLPISAFMAKDVM
jgi:hypothetical protein